MVEVRSCGVLIYRRDPSPSFLLMRHAKRWDLPKGHVDPGETHLQCALRELKEETGIKKKHIKLDPDFEFRYQYTVVQKRHAFVPKLKELIVYLAELVKPVKIDLTEHVGYEWFAWEPPHKIQEKTIDPLLKELDSYWSNSKKGP